MQDSQNKSIDQGSKDLSDKLLLKMTNPHLQFIGCCKEINTGYATDGYACVRGIAEVGQQSTSL